MVKDFRSGSRVAGLVALAILATGFTVAAQTAARRPAYAFPHHEDLGYARWIHTLEAPDPAAIDLRQSAPFPSTRLLLPFDDFANGATVDAVDGTRLACAAKLVPGARGEAFVLERPLEVPLAEDLPDEWSLFLWVQVNGTPGEILALDGHVVAELGADGTLAVRAGGGRVELELAPGWSWVGLASERLAGTRLRIATSNEVRRIPLAPAEERPRRPKLTLGAGPALDDFRLEDTALSTLAFERLVDPPRPGEGGSVRLAVRGADGTRLLERFRTLSARPELSGADLASGALSHWLATDGGLAWTPGQWRQDDPDQGPKPRTTHPTLAIEPGRVWVFGGEVIDSHGGPYTNDAQAWSYDLARRSWTLEADDGTGPSPRCHLSAASSTDGDEVLLVGGWCNASDLPHAQFADAWSLRRSTGEWTRWETPERMGTSDLPLVFVPELDGCLYFLRHNVVLFRFADRGHRVLPHAPTLDREGRPAERLRGFSHSHVYDAPRRRVLLFGGQESDGETSTFHSQLHAFEVEANVFRDLGEGGPAPRVRPGFARDSHRDRIVLFGGVHEHDSERFDDLWVLDPRTDAWSERTAAGAPSARGGYFHMAYDVPSDRFVLVLGRHAFDRFLDEVWRLHLEDRAVASGTWAFRADVVEDGELVAFAEGSWSSEDTLELDAWRTTDEADGAPVVLLRVRAVAADQAAPPRLVRVGFCPASERPPHGLRRLARPLR